MFPRRIIFAAFAISTAASFLLCGYEFIRAVSTSLFINAYRADNLTRVWIAVPPSVILMIYIYGRLLSWFGASRALAISSVLSSLLLLVCYYALLGGIDFASAVIYVFREAYIVIIIEQFWSFVNSTLTTKQAKTISGPFCAIASLGSYAGGKLVSRWAETLGTETLLLFTAGSLIPVAFFGILAYRFAGEPKPSVDEEGGKRGHLGLKTFLSSKYLILLGALILTTQVISTVLDLRFNKLVENNILDTDTMTAYYGNFYANLGLIAAVLQLTAVPIVLRLISIRFVHICIPIVHFINGFVLTLIPSLKTGARAFLTFKALDYSFFRAAKELFYMPLTYDERYRAKQIVDSFGYRFGKGGSASVIELIRSVLALIHGIAITIPGAALSITAIIASCIWSGVVLNITTHYQKIMKTEKNVDNDDSIR